MSASIEQIWNIVASRPKFVFSLTSIFCSLICSNNCGEVFLWKYILVFEKRRFLFDHIRVIFTVKNLHLWAVERKKIISRKTKINFYKNTTSQLLEHIGLQNMKVGGKINLGDLPLFVWCMLTLALKLILIDNKRNKVLRSIDIDTNKRACMVS